MTSILKEKIKNKFIEKQFSLKKSNYKNKMSPKEIFGQLSLNFKFTSCKISLSRSRDREIGKNNFELKQE